MHFFSYIYVFFPLLKQLFPWGPAHDMLPPPTAIIYHSALNTTQTAFITTPRWELFINRSYLSCCCTLVDSVTFFCSSCRTGSGGGGVESAASVSSSVRLTLGGAGILQRSWEGVQFGGFCQVFCRVLVKKWENLKFTFMFLPIQISGFFCRRRSRYKTSTKLMNYLQEHMFSCLLTYIHTYG